MFAQRVTQQTHPVCGRLQVQLWLELFKVPTQIPFLVQKNSWRDELKDSIHSCSRNWAHGRPNLSRRFLVAQLSAQVVLLEMPTQNLETLATKFDRDVVLKLSTNKTSSLLKLNNRKYNTHFPLLFAYFLTIFYTFYLMS